MAPTVVCRYDLIFVFRYDPDCPPDLAETALKQLGANWGVTKHNSFMKFLNFKTSFSIRALKYSIENL
jgi:hypothetical protein